jgi:hypothetical protein
LEKSIGSVPTNKHKPRFHPPDLEEEEPERRESIGSQITDTSPAFTLRAWRKKSRREENEAPVMDGVALFVAP